MLNKIRKIYNKKYIEYFIMSQPIIDLITAFMINDLKSNLTIGMLIRGIFLLYAIAYLLLFDNKGKKYNILYLGLILIFCITNILINMSIKPNYFLFSEMVNLFKLFYFPILLLFFYRYYKNEEKIQFNPLIVSSFIISFSILLANLTHTANLSYGSGPNSKIGDVGWFYSPNEIGAILGILFPFVLYSFIIEKKNWARLNLILVIYALFAIGTKVAYLSILVTTVGVIILRGVIAIIGKERIPDYIIKLALLVLGLTIVITPFTPIAHNMGVHLGKLEIKSLDNIFGKDEDKIDNLIFFGREKYLSDMKIVYKKATISQKLFGLGRKENYLDGKLAKEYIERDFHDVFYYYGIFGFILFIIPMAYIIINKVKVVIKNLKKVDMVIISIILSIFIALFAGYIAGHVLLYPSVSTYVAIIIAMLTFFTDNLKDNRKRMI